jgi:hypothetical protein
MRIVGLAIAGAVVLFVVLGIVANAQGDITAPVVVDIIIDPLSIDTSQMAQTITISARITDDLSGVDFATIGFTPEIGTTQQHEVQFYEDHLVDGDYLDGIFVGTITLPRYAAEGRWDVEWVGTRDEVGNYEYADPEEYDHYAFTNAPKTVPTLHPTATPTLYPTPTLEPTPVSTLEPQQPSNHIYIPSLLTD